VTEKPEPDLYPKLDRDLYPEHVECPHCRKRSKVLFHFDQLVSCWRAYVEKHDVVDVQCTFNARKACNLTYACPASLASVSPWEPVR
jgi:hypothetical protein